MRGRTVVKSFHQGQSFTPLFFLMFFCTQRMAKSWICTGHTASARLPRGATGPAGRTGAQHPHRHPGTLPFISMWANCSWLICCPITSGTRTR